MFLVIPPLSSLMAPKDYGAQVEGSKAGELDAFDKVKI
jgi:hypothetical protein